jgi:hypothetical protein
MAGNLKQPVESADSTRSFITEADLEGLPEPVQRNVRFTRVIGKRRINTVRLKQEGVLKLKPGQKWLPVYARQYFTTNPPGFLWQANMKMNPLLRVSGKDMYSQGKGNMKMKLWSFIKFSDVKGPKLDQGTMLRYLSEIIWFPTAYLSDYLKWEIVDTDTAKVTMKYGGITASAQLHYDNGGRLTRFVADRYMGGKDDATLEKWSVEPREYEEIHGLMIPLKGEVTWNLASGDFTWIKLKITEINYNVP